MILSKPKNIYHDFLNNIDETRKVNHFIYLGFFVGFFIITIISVFSYVSISSLNRALSAEERMYEDFHVLNGILIHLHRMESIQRGYILTGNDDYLDEIRESRSEVLFLLNIYSYNKSPFESTIIPQIREKVSFMDESLDVARGNRFAAAEMISSNRGKIMMDGITNSIGIIEQKLATELLSLKKRTEEIRSYTNITIAVGLLFSAIVVIFTLQRAGQAIKERSLMISALEASEEHHRLLVQSLHEGVILLDKNGRVKTTNNSFSNITMLSQDELFNCSVNSLMQYFYTQAGRQCSPENFPPLITLQTGAIQENSEIRYSKDGKDHWVLMNSYPVKNPVNPESILAVVVSVFDITERKLNSIAMTQFNFRLQTLLDNLNSGVMLVDEARRIIFLNETLCEFFGCKKAPDSFVGQDLEVIVDQWSAHFPDREEFKRELLERFDNRQYTAGREILSGMRIYERDFFPVIIQGQFYGGLFQFRDVTVRKQTEDELVKAREAALAAAVAKGEFLASMSHEIRTPLNSILGMSELLWELDLPEEARKYVSIFRKAGSHLQQLINDILDISRLETGFIELEEIPFDPGRLMDEVADLFGSSAKSKGLEFLVHKESMPERIIGDPARLRQILTNLIGNAIKFTETGFVRIDIEEQYASDESYDSGNSILNIKVSDSGKGIPIDRQEAIFDVFTQADSTIARHYGGTGLGLPIARKLSRLMGGDLYVQSKEGQGSSFNLKIPCIVASRDLPDGQSVRVISEVSENVSGPKNLADITSYRIDPGEVPSILLVDDSEDNRFLVKAYLKNVPCIIVEARNGIEAIEYYKDTVNGKSNFSVFLLDMLMPEIDGYTATQEIRKIESEENLQPVPVIALTAYALQSEVDKSFEAGCNLHVTKPVKKDTLLGVLASYINLSKVSK